MSNSHRQLATALALAILAVSVVGCTSSAGPAPSPDDPPVVAEPTPSTDPEETPEEQTDVEPAPPDPEEAPPSTPDGGTAPPESKPAPATPTDTPSRPTPALSAASRAKMLYRTASDVKQVVLTFDDGPSQYTNQITEILENEGVPAAFFFVGGKAGVDWYTASLTEAGYQVGAHGMNHKKLTLYDTEVKQEEMSQSQLALSQLLTSPVRYFRPPNGGVDDEVVQIAESLGLQIVMWTVDSRDWELADNPGQIVANVMQNVRPGAIILLHERPQTVEVLPTLIAQLKAEGYQFGLLP